MQAATTQHLRQESASSVRNDWHRLHRATSPATQPVQSPNQRLRPVPGDFVSGDEMSPAPTVQIEMPTDCSDASPPLLAEVVYAVKGMKLDLDERESAPQRVPANRLSSRQRILHRAPVRRYFNDESSEDDR